MQDMRLEMRAVDALIPYARNARIHSDAQVAQIAASIREFGWGAPIIIDGKDNIVAGHGRLLAARKLGMTEVPVVPLDHLTDTQRRAMILADNKIGENAPWDDELLGLELAELKGLGVDGELVGFSGEEIKSFEPTPVGLTDPDVVPEAPTVPVTVRGDIWVLDGHRIICGDCTEATTVAKALRGGAHLMVTDPPYGVEYDPKWRAEAGVNRSKGKMGVVLNDDRADWREAWALFPGDVVYVWHSGLFAGLVADSLQSCGFGLRSQIIWVKDRFALSRGDYHWQHEPCWYGVRKGVAGRYDGGRSQSTRWDINSRDDGGFGHGTQKPVECMRRPIENNSKAGDAVYDPFSGSGTTIIAAEMTGRRCYAIELNPAYVDVAVRRWQDFTGKVAINEATGKSFND